LVLGLFGAGQINKRKIIPSKGCHANRWGVTEITPGMIAAAAVTVSTSISSIHLLNDDMFLGTPYYIS
jgi:hypothetical protein